MDKKFLDKFFKLYSKCSRLYAKLTNIDNYLIISYYKKDDLIYPYQYIDFGLLFCNATGQKNQLNNKFLQSEYICEKNQFMMSHFKDRNFDQLSILSSLKNIIEKDFVGLDRISILALNNIYKEALSQNEKIKYKFTEQTGNTR